MEGADFKDIIGQPLTLCPYVSSLQCSTKRTGMWMVGS